MTRQHLLQDYVLSNILIYRDIMLLKKSRYSVSSINKAQLEVLYILDTKGALKMSEIAETTNTTSGAVTQLIDRLTHLGYVHKTSNEHDKRLAYVEFTVEGREKFNRIKSEHLHFISTLLQGLTDDEVRLLHSIQQKVLKAIK